MKSLITKNILSEQALYFGDVTMPKNWNIDRNKLQSIKSTEQTLSLEPLIDKFKSFNWEVSNIDGHSHELLKRELIFVPP